MENFFNGGVPASAVDEAYENGVGIASNNNAGDNRLTSTAAAAANANGSNPITPRFGIGLKTIYTY